MKLSGATKLLLPVGAICAFSMCLWLAYQDKTATATLLAGLFCICVLFVYFPQLESFKAFTVEAKLREKVDEAKGLLEKLAAISAASSRFIYLTMQADVKDHKPDWIARSTISKQIKDVLSGLDIVESEVKSIQGDFFIYIRPKIFSAFNGVALLLVFDHNFRRAARLQEIREAKPHDHEQDAEYNSLRTGSTVHFLDGVADEYLASPEYKEKIAEKYKGFFTEKEIGALISFNSSFYDLYKECVQKSFLTEDAAKMILRAEDTDWKKKKFVELFGREQVEIDLTKFMKT